MLAVVVRELSKHQGAFLFDCCVFIARFASSSCYSSVKTRIRPVKLYQARWSTVAGLCCSLPVEYRLPPGYPPEVVPRDSTQNCIGKNDDGRSKLHDDGWMLKQHFYMEKLKRHVYGSTSGYERSLLQSR